MTEEPAKPLPPAYPPQEAVKPPRRRRFQRTKTTAGHAGTTTARHGLTGHIDENPPVK